jgi:nucleoside transporter
MSDPTPGRTAASVKARLSGAMFLQWFVQGSYLPIATVYLQKGLGFSDGQIGLFIAAIAIGPLLAPFLIGQLADRWLATERVLALCHLAAGALMLALYAQTEFLPVFLLGAAYSIIYVPTLMLMNALTFHHLRDRDREFPFVRLWGTVGFIVPAFLIEGWLLHGLTGAELSVGRGVAFLVAGLAELALAVYCLALPHTPPKQDQASRFAPGAVLRLLRRADFRVLVAAGLLAGVCHSFFTVWNSPYLRWLLSAAGEEGAAEQRISTVGQFSEVACMALLSMALVRFGYRTVLTVGVLGYGARYLMFAAVPHFDGPLWATVTLVSFGQAMHGVSLSCFWAAGFIYVDRVAGAEVRGSMQTFFGTFVLGLGLLLGALLSGLAVRAFTVDPSDLARRPQLLAQAIAVQGLVSTGPTSSVIPQGAIPLGVAAVDAFPPARDWRAIWLVPMGIAVATAVTFALLFRPRVAEAPG